MIGHTTLTSSETHTWETPIDLFNSVNAVYNFTLDACAEDLTAKVVNYYTKEQDALIQDWKGVVWCNPPYGRQQGKFVLKAIEEVVKGNAKTVVCLIPSRTDTKLWQEHIFKHASEVFFIKGRLRFSGSSVNAPFPSALVVFGEVGTPLTLEGFSTRKT